MKTNFLQIGHAIFSNNKYKNNDDNTDNCGLYFSSVDYTAAIS